VRRLGLAAGLVAVGLAASVAGTAAAQPAPKVSDYVPAPGRSIAAADDTTAIALNPANLAFLPGAELRWNWVYTQSASPMPNRGHEVAFGFPLWMLATGLRVDALDPPRAAPAPFDNSYQWLRWGLAFRGGDVASFGTTFAWSFSESPSLAGYFSLTSGLTVRPTSFLSVSAVARDWNHPHGKSGLPIERSYDLGVAVRPFLGRREFEIGLEASHFDTSDVWVPRGTVAIDVPRLGRLRGDISLVGPDSSRFVATAGLDVHLGGAELSGGGVFGSQLTRSGAGFYAGAALRGFREPGVVLPAHVVRVKIDGVPGVRRHVKLLRKLWRLAGDPEVAGVVLDLHAEPASSLAHAEEVGEAVRLLRAQGKKVLCEIEDGGGRSLFVCSQADRIAMNPAGGLRFAGLSSSYLYFGGLLKNLGVRADFVRIGAHKGAAESFTHETGTDVAKADHQELVAEMEKVMLSDVGGGQKVSVPELKDRIAKGPFIAPEARAAGLVDTLAYPDETDRVIEEMFGKRVRITDDAMLDKAPERWGDQGKVAMIYLSGDMVDGDSQFIPLVNIRLAGSRTIARALKRAREDQSVKAVVFRVETGGGSSLAADVILREAQLTAKVKPFVVSMGSAAASGGYYASMAGGGPVFANRATVTGSIGIFYGKVDVSGLLAKIGVGVDLFRSAPRADAESFYRAFTEDERVELGRKVKQFYDVFVARVAEGRHMTAEQVDAVARGKVWTGAQAKDKGLVDKLGGLREALREARALAHLPADAPIVEMPDDDESLIGMLLGLTRASAQAETEAIMKATVPPALLGVAQALAPFLVHDPDKPLARMEMIDLPGGLQGGATSEP
jgi:protease-4